MSQGFEGFHLMQQSFVMMALIFQALTVVQINT
jgi:hypothetical protein